jgi:hypothetical protein
VATGVEYLGLYKSSTRGTSWQLLPQAAAIVNNNCDCNFTHTIGVDPKDSNRVYLGFTNLYGSPDGGQTWPLTGNNVHLDFHALVFSPPFHVSGSPTSPTPFYVGTDGEIAKTSNGPNFTGVNGKAPHGIATNLFGPPIDIGRGSAENNQHIYGGMEDTGTGVHRPDPDLPALEWDMTHGGDGDQVAVDPTNPKKAYSARGGQYMTTTDGGKTEWISPLPGSTGLPSCCKDANGVEIGSVGRPILVDPDDSINVYVVDSQGQR